MTPNETQTPVLEYARPGGGFARSLGRRVGRVLRRIPQPSRWTIVLLLLAGLAAAWLWYDHGVWGLQETWRQAGGPVGRLSPDGTRVVAGFEAPSRVYEIPSGRELLRFGEPGEKAAYAQFSPDSSRLITAGGSYAFVLKQPRGSAARGNAIRSDVPAPEPGFVCLRDATTGKVLGNYAQVDPLSMPPFPMFSPDGRRLLVTEPSRAMLYDTATGAAVATLEERDGADEIGTAFFSPDSRMVAIFVGRDGRVHFRSAEDGSLLARYKVDVPPVISWFHATFSPDGATFALCADESLHLIDTQTGRHRIAPVALRRMAMGLAFSPDGTRVIVLHPSNGGGGTDLSAVDVATGIIAARKPFRGRAGAPIFWASPDGGQMFMADPGGPIYGLDPTTLATVPALPAGARFSSDFSRAVVIAAPARAARTVAQMLTKRIEVLAAPTGAGPWPPLSALEAPGIAGDKGRLEQVVDVAFAGDVDHLLTGTNGGTMQLWRRRRPEPEWGIIALPQCWLTVALGAALFAFAARDLLRYCSPASVQR